MSVSYLAPKPGLLLLMQVYIAAAAVTAEQEFELSLLANARTAASTPFLNYLPTLWDLTSAGRDAFDAQQMWNATCVCGANATAALQGTAGFVNETFWQADNCTGAPRESARATNS